MSNNEKEPKNKVEGLEEPDEATSVLKDTPNKTPTQKKGSRRKPPGRSRRKDPKSDSKDDPDDDNVSVSSEKKTAYLKPSKMSLSERLCAYQSGSQPPKMSRSGWKQICDEFSDVVLLPRKSVDKMRENLSTVEELLGDIEAGGASKFLIRRIQAISKILAEADPPEEEEEE